MSGTVVGRRTAATSTQVEELFGVEDRMRDVLPNFDTRQGPFPMETTYTFGVDAELTKVSDGSFVLSLATMANQAGEWEFLVSGTGAAGGSKRERFLVAA